MSDKTTTKSDWLRYFDDIYDPRVQQVLYEMLTTGEESTEDVISYILQIDKKRRDIQYGQFKRLKGDKARRFEWDDPREADGVPILAREEKNVVKVNYRSHTPFDRAIVTNKKAYLMGIKPEITAGDAFAQWAGENNFHTILSEVTEDAVGQGEGFTLLYSPPGSREVFITKEQAYNCVVIYDPDTGRPTYGLIYMYKTLLSADQKDAVSLSAYWYTERDVTEYEGSIFSVKRAGDPVPHLFQGVPLIEWRNNSERISDIEPVLGLMDLYDIMDSDLASELGQLRLAYLFLKGMGYADQLQAGEYGNGEDDPAKSISSQLQRAGWIAAEGEDADMKFISKDINVEAVKYEKDDLKSRIFQMANSYDPVSVQGADSNVTAFQIRMKLFPLEQSTAETVLHFQNAFKYMFELLSDFYTNFGAGMASDEEPEIIFKRNIPSNIVQDMIDARTAGFFISQNQIADRLPFAIDQELNAAELEAEADRLLVTPDVPEVMGDDEPDR